MSSPTRQLNQASKRGYFVTRRDFRQLHLRAGETDIRQIRSGAERIARARTAAVEANINSGDVAVDLVSDVAVAAYRLMDPRRRASLSQRVRLCYPLDRNSMEPPKPPAGRVDLAAAMATVGTVNTDDSEHSNSVKVSESVVDWVELAKETSTIQQARDLVRTLKAHSADEADSQESNADQSYPRILVDRFKKWVGLTSLLLWFSVTQ